MRSKFLTSTVLMLSSAACAAESPTLAAALEAREVIDRAAEAHGGVDTLRMRAPTRITMDTAFAAYAQNLVAGQSEPGLPAKNAVWFDAAGGRIRADNENTFHGGYSFRSRTVLDAKSGVTENLSRMGPGDFVTTIDAANLATARMNAAWLAPHAIVLEALERPLSLVVRGRVTDGGHRNVIVDYARTNGSQAALVFDEATGLLRGYQLAVDHPVLGDTVATVTFDGYREDHGVMLPAERVQRLGDEVTRRDRYRYDWTPVSDADFARATPPATPAALAPNGWESLADGVFLLRNYSGYNALAVEFADHVVMVEAPIDSGIVRTMLDRVQKETGKPVRHVVLTHHHGDHAGGVREVIAAGIPVTTTAGNVAHFERVANAQRRLRPDAQQRNRKPARFDLVDGTRTFADRTQRLEIVSVGRNSHAEELLVAWLPKAGVLFQGDLLILPDHGTSPPIAVNRELAALIERERWEVDAIAGAHGRVGTMGDLRATLGTKSVAGR